MAQYSLVVLKVPLKINQTNSLGLINRTQVVVTA